MCNAWNHPPGCRCGWGGEGHLGYSYGGSFDSHTTHLTRPTYESFVNPNAYCPVCNARVFFYQSPHGGRVFFDELGPPWPKHPCTDSQSIYKPNPSTAPGNIWGTKFSWQIQNWEPFFCTKARLIPSNQTALHGQFIAEDSIAMSKFGAVIADENEECLLYVRGNYSQFASEVLFVKPIAESPLWFEIAVFTLDEGEVEEKPVYMRAYVPAATNPKITTPTSESVIVKQPTARHSRPKPLAQLGKVRGPLATPEQLKILRQLLHEYGWDYTVFLQEAGALPRYLSTVKAAEWIKWFRNARKHHPRERLNR